MAKAQWIPSRADAPGLALIGTFGAAAVVLVRVLPPSPLLSDILIALTLGALVVNTPLRQIFGLVPPSFERESDRWAAGLRFAGKWVLRLSIILMGLKVQTRIFGARELSLIGGIAIVALPSTFFITHTMGRLLGVRRPLADLLAGGTMICGASAVNAIAPVARAHRSEQGIAIAAVFSFSVFALVTFHPLAELVGLAPAMAGLWSGLAVNDLSSAIAVGTQMGGAGGVMATAAKSARVLLLAPTLIVLSFLRRDGAPRGLTPRLLDLLPRYLLGYLALAVVRAVGDRVFGDVATWTLFLRTDSLAVDFLLAAVAAGIGLHLELRNLIAAGARVLATAGAASIAMASLTLAMIALVARGASATAALVGVAALATTGAGYTIANARERQARVGRRRFESGAPLSLGEAIGLLDRIEADGALDDALLRRLLAQLHPSIGELIPARKPTGTRRRLTLAHLLAGQEWLGAGRGVPRGRFENTHSRASASATRQDHRRQRGGAALRRTWRRRAGAGGAPAVRARRNRRDRRARNAAPDSRGRRQARHRSAVARARAGQAGAPLRRPRPRPGQPCHRLAGSDSS
jgi:uncharacterized integral membrane protein (TIGR00698 family)